MHLFGLSLFLFPTLYIQGDRNVPAGYTSLTVFLDKPIVLTLADQETVFDMLTADAARDEEAYAQLMASRGEGEEGPDLRQPFAVPLDCVDRGTEPHSTCMAR